MNHPRDIDGLLESYPTKSDAECVEIVLNHLNNVLQGLSTEMLRFCRAHCIRMQSAERDQTVVVEVIDGLLALREMAEISR